MEMFMHWRFLAVVILVVVGLASESGARAGGGRRALRGVGLFDLKNDPNENQNVADNPEYADVLKRLQGRLRAMRSTDGS